MEEARLTAEKKKIQASKNQHRLCRHTRYRSFTTLPKKTCLLTSNCRLLVALSFLDTNTFPDVLPEVSKLRVRQTVHDSIHEYGIMLPLLKQELEETQAELTGETQLLKELKEIRRALQARRQDLATTGEAGSSQKSSQGRTKMLETKVLVQELMRELTGFLARYYPPIQPDVSCAYCLKRLCLDSALLQCCSTRRSFQLTESFYWLTCRTMTRQCII